MYKSGFLNNETHKKKHVTVQDIDPRIKMLMLCKHRELPCMENFDSVADVTGMWVMQSSVMFMQQIFVTMQSYCCDSSRTHACFCYVPSFSHQCNGLSDLNIRDKKNGFRTKTLLRIQLLVVRVLLGAHQPFLFLTVYASKGSDRTEMSFEPKNRQTPQSIGASKNPTGRKGSLFPFFFLWPLCYNCMWLAPKWTSPSNTD